MWVIWGLLFLLLAAARSTSYAVWLWEHNQGWACFGVTLLTTLSLALPFLIAIGAR